ncbi:MAG TPA: hypothetical protein VHE35_04270, partial [Kofleriaceae bacterium]|nr:hypothetical protein [Kofleriaceae bacterium]
LSRADFNRLAAEHALPLFWRADADGDHDLDPDELVTTWGLPGPSRAELVAGDHFTPRFEELYTTLTAPAPSADLAPAERARRAAVVTELAQGLPTLVETDQRQATAEDRAIVDHVLAAAAIIDRIYARQQGVLGLDARIPADDPASRTLFWRNHGPFCKAPKTERNPDCSALPDHPKPVSGLYPAAIQAQPGFCDRLAKQPNAADLMNHFSVVQEGTAPGTFVAVPFSVAYQDDMQAVAKELEAAAAAVTSPDEAAFVDYLKAAAQAFRDNDWEKADVAWAAMGARGSHWYLRVAPDEVYEDPCAWKAGFQVSFARINPGSVEWRQKLEPVKADMENALAALAGKPYVARQVAFRLPDFIDIIVNAGDARAPSGATIGESLPNWGKVAEAGGRTVAMTNLYTDADSAATLLAQTSSLFCPATQAGVETDPSIELMTTVLHEASHNLGPAHDYKVGGKTDDVLFGGTLASTLEELKAQTAALYFSDWLVARGVVPDHLARASHLRDLAWAFGHIAQGMYAADGTPKNYSQLAAMQVGSLVAAGVIQWKADQKAANGTDAGCFEVDLDAWKPAVEALTARVLKIKGAGDKQDALAMKASFVDDKDAWGDLRGVIADRWLRAPRATMVYSVRR